MLDWGEFLIIVMIMAPAAFMFIKLAYPVREESLQMLEYPYFDIFEKKFSEIDAHSPKSNCEKFALDEFRRFRSIAGTVLDSFKNQDKDGDQRILTHILIRSLLENYFWLLYIFYENNSSSWDARFDEYLNGFKREYDRLYKDPHLPFKSKIEPTNPSWSSLRKPMDINSMLEQLLNDYGNRLSYLYFTYRITSFDTHGKSKASLFQSAFGKDCNFPYLKSEEVFNLIANEYLLVWDKIK